LQSAPVAAVAEHGSLSQQMNHPPYKLTFCEADTGIVLNGDGSRWSREGGTELFQPTFPSLDEARIFKDRLLAQTPNGEVTIECDGERLEVHRDHERLKKFMEERQAYFAWMSLPPWIRIFKRKPRCEIYNEG
jgi:hypothetical protein